jgi:hypothetical protein
MHSNGRQRTSMEGFLALLTTNILTNTAFNAAISGLIGTALGVRTYDNLVEIRRHRQKKE